MIRAAALAACLALAGCALFPKSEEAIAREQERMARDEQLAVGGSVALALCRSCHAVGEWGDSPNPAAPRFRELQQRYRFDVLEEELREGVHIGDAQMPTFDLTIAETDALIAYLRSLQDPAARRSN